MKMNQQHCTINWSDQSARLPDGGNGSAKLPKVDIPQPFPELPAKLIIAIDGWAQTGKTSTGEVLAEHLGGVLVDSGRFYRAITKGCIENDVDLMNMDAVAAWCRRATMDIRLARVVGVVDEVQVAVNGRWFTREELMPLGLHTSLVAAVPQVREWTNAALRLCDCYGRVVMLGRDIGGVVFPQTPYKFFLDATEDVREQRHLASTNSLGAKKRDASDAGRVCFTEDALLIDTSEISVAEVAAIILSEVVRKAPNPTNKPPSR